MERGTQNVKSENTLRDARCAMRDIYHIDAYRITSKDLIELGFKDFSVQKNSITIIEWPENVKRIIPTDAVWINFEWISDKERKITLSTKKWSHATHSPV